MEKPSEDTKYCSNCRRDIAASNYLMHTMHCQRNLKLCERCDEPIPRNELDQHMQELHSQVPCGKCSAIVECCKLEDHMRTACTKRTIKCSFCDLECILDEMKTHESYCGSRTEICSYCRQYVMIKEMEEHDLGNCAKAMAKKQSESNKIDALNNFRTEQRTSGSSYRVPAEAVENTDVQPEVWSYQPNATLEADTTSPDIYSDINQSSLDEQLALDLAREDFESLQASQYGELWEHSFDDETVPPYPRTLIPTMLGQRAVIPGYNNDEFIIPVVDSVSDIHSDVGTTQVESDEVELLPCEFCGELYPSEVLIQHQSGCNPEAAHGTTVKGFRDDSSETNNTQSVLREENLHGDADTIPCEFCNKCFSSDYLIQHESQCRPDIVHGPPPWIRKDKQVTNKPSVVSTYADSPNIPCEFCSELFPHQLVIDHQNTCDANTLEPILSDELYPSIVEDHIDRKEHTLKHQEDPQLEEITSMATSNAFVKERDILPASNKKPIQVIELGQSPNKELEDTVSETSRHSYSQSKSLCDNKRKNIVTNFTNVDSYFERRDRNYHSSKLQKDIFRRMPDYRSMHDASPQSHTPFSKRDGHFYSERLHYRDDWSSIPADEDNIARKEQALKHLEDPRLEEITSVETFNAFVKERDILPESNKKPIQVIELGQSPNKELEDTVSETSRHSYSQSKALCDNKRKNVATHFPNVDSYFERTERNYHSSKLQKDIFRRMPDYENLHDTSPQSHIPFVERDGHCHSERLHYRDDWSSIPAGARPKNCPDTCIQDGLHSAVSLSRDPCNIDTQPKPKFSSRMAATLPPPLTENLSRDIRDARPQEYSAKHACLHSPNQLSENDAGKSKSMKRKGMELHRR